MTELDYTLAKLHERQGISDSKKRRRHLLTQMKRAFPGSEVNAPKDRAYDYGLNDGHVVHTALIGKGREYRRSPPSSLGYSGVRPWDAGPVPWSRHVPVTGRKRSPGVPAADGSATAEQTGRPRGGFLLRHRDFRLLWGGETISALGSQISILALPLIAVRTLHATIFQVGALSAASTAAFLIVGLPAGVWVDRSRRNRIMIAADAGRMLTLASVPAAYAAGVLGMAQLYVVTLLAGILTVFFDVSYQSYLPSLVGRDHLEEGNAKMSGSEQVAQVAGRSLAGGLIQGVGGAQAVALDAASFLVSAIAVTAIRTREPALPVREGSHRRLHVEITEGLRLVLGHPLLRAISATTATANLFASISMAVQIVFLVRTVHAPLGFIGLLFAAGSVGGLLAALAATPVARRIGGARATLAGIFCGVGGLLVPLTTPGPGLILFAVGLFTTSFGGVLYNINQVSFRQRLCPQHLLGRMNASMRFVVWGVLPIGGLLGGVIGTAIGLRSTLWLAAVGQALAGVWLLTSPIRRMRDFPTRQSPWDAAGQPG